MAGILREGTVVTEPRSDLAELYVRHVPAANRLAFLLTGDPSQAEDLVHDAFVRCVGRFGHLRAHEAFEAYLRRTIVNLHTSRLRRLRLERAFLSRTKADPERTATAAAAAASGTGAPLLRGPVGARDGRGAAVLGRRGEVTDGARDGRAARRDQG
jgi:RNA polymerase sigma factor (sigma-70 family)